MQADTSTDQAEDTAESASAPPAAVTGVRGWWPVVVLFVLSAATYMLLGRLVAVPIIAPDEYNYGHLARSLADGEGFMWGGGPFPLRSALYVFLLTPLWTLDSQLDAYEWSKLLGAATASAVVFPTWLLARPLLGPRMALIPAALSVTGAWMTVTGLILTENLAYPLGVASLAAMVPAVARPGSRWSIAALVLAVLAMWARSQLIVLPAILVLAIAADVARFGPDWRERLRGHRVVAGITGAIVVVGFVVVVASPSVLGLYSGITSGSIPLGEAVDGSRDQLAALLVLTGFLPFLVTLAGSAQRGVWRDPAIAPLLAVTWSAALVLVVQSGLALVRWDVAWSIERYVAYGVPLLLVAMTALLARGLIDWRRLAAATVGALVLALLIPGTRSYIEEPALFGLNRRMDALLGTSTATSVAIAAALVGGLMVLAVYRFGRRPAVAVATAAVLTAGVLAVQSQGTWAHRDASTTFWRAGFPDDLSWIDRQVDGPVAQLVVFDSAFRHPITEFFNRRIIRTYLLDAFPVANRGVLGRKCTWTLNQADGGVTFEPGCGPPPTRLLLNDEAARVTFHDQQVLAEAPRVGRVVGIPARTPRLEALVQPSCSTPLPVIEAGGTAELLAPRPRQCNQGFGANLWLDAPATLVARFRGGTEPGSVVVGQGTYTLDAARPTTLRFRQPKGFSQLMMTVPTSGPPPQFPQLTSLVLRQPGRSTELLY